MPLRKLAGGRTVAPKGARIGLAAVALVGIWSIAAAGQSTSVRWVTGYYAAYTEATVNMHPSDVDYAALTHVIHWPVVPLGNGTFNPDTYGLTAAQSAEVVSRAHAAGTKVLLGFGGDAATVGNGWQGATSPANRAAFIANMVNLMQSRGYDGIDINWEELTLADQMQFTALVTELRAALDAILPRPLLTVVPTTGSDVPVTLVNAVKDKFDQINIQTYVMSGPYPGWVTWFNSPIYNGGFTFPSTGGPVPSADAEVGRFVVGGIPVGNLGIGIQFDGAMWAGGSGTDTGGVTKPRQVWTYGPPRPDGSDPGAPTLTFVRAAQVIAACLAIGCTKTFDPVARVPWMGWNDPVDAKDLFITYDDEQAIQEKANYIGSKGLGGVFVFELSGDFFPGATGDARHPLLAAIRQSFSTSPGTSPRPSLTLALNGTLFHSGETMALTVTMTPADTPVVVDAYIVIQVPEGQLFSLRSGGGVTPGLAPVASGVVPVAFTGEAVRYTFGGGEPVGSYTWFTTLTEHGSLNIVGGVHQGVFAFTP